MSSWKSAFSGRSETGSVSGRSSSHRKKSGADSTSSRRPEEEKKRSDRSSRSSVYGDDEGKSTYATAPSSRVGEPRALTESAVSLLDNDEEIWEDDDKDARSERKSLRSHGSRHRRRSEKERSRSRSREKGRKYRTGSRKESEAPRGKPRTEDGGGNRGIPEMGSMAQFPGQYSGGMMGPTGTQEPMMSAALPTRPTPDNQFGLSRADSYGAAADYYLDEGQSVTLQPGVRTNSPNMLVNPDHHLMAASAEEQPAEDTGHGSAADFYSGKISPVLTAEPQTIKPSKFSLRRPSKPSKTPSFGAAVAATAAAGLTMGAAASSSASYQSQTQSTTSFHKPSSSSSKPHYQASRHNSKPVTSGSTGAYYAPLQQQRQPGSIPGNTGKQPTNPNAGLYAAGAAATAGLAAHEMNQRHEHQSHTPSASPYAGTQYTAPPSYAAPPSYTSRAPPDMNGGPSMQHQHQNRVHEHKGPMTRLKDGLLNLIASEEDTIKMEMYTEYIGVCKHCFDPRTSPYDAPRRHHYHSPTRRGSFEDLRRRRSAERMRRSSRENLGRNGNARVDKDSRYYPDRKKTGSKTDLVGVGLATAGVVAGANALFNSDNRNFDDTYSVKSGHRDHSAVRRRSRSSSREKRRRASHGVVGRGSEDEYITVRRTDGRMERRKIHRSRSRSGDRRADAMGATAGAALGASAVAAGRSRRSHEHSLNGTFIRRRSGSRSSSSSHGGGIFGFFSPSRQKRRGSRPELRKKRKERGFFSFGNDSASSSGSDLAFGASRTDLPLRRKPSMKSTTKKRKSDDHLAATVAGIGATAAALAVAQKGNRISKRSSRPELGPARDVKHRQLARRHGEPPSSDGEWEDELPSGANSGSDLAFGDYDKKLVRRQSRDSVGSQSSSGASGLGAWGWRWGGKDKKTQKKRRVPSPPPAYPPHPLATGPGIMDAGVTGGAALDAAGRPSRAESVLTSTSSTPQPPMQYVDPRPLSDAGSLPGSRHTSMPGAFDDVPYVATARPGIGTIQQPQPVAPIQPAFTQQNPLDFDEHRPLPRRTQSSPTQGSSFVKDAALIGAAAVGTAALIASQGRKPKDVRFEDQERRSEQDRRKAGEERRRADRARALKEEAERFSREQDVLRARAEENRRVAEAELEREREAEEQAEIERQRVARREAEEQAELERQRVAKREAEAQAELYRQRLRERQEMERREAEITERIEQKKRELERERQEEDRRERERRTEERRQYQQKEDESSKQSSVPWGAVAAGAAAAGVGAIALAENERSQDSRSEADKRREVYAAQEIKPMESFSSVPVMDDDLYDPEYFKRNRSQSPMEYARHVDDLTHKAADRVTSVDRMVAENDAYYAEPAQTQAEFFAPKEILSQWSEGKTKVADPIDDNVVHVYNAADLKTKEKFESEHGVSSSGPKRFAPYGVPALSLITPTPPASAMGRRSATATPSPLTQETEAQAEGGARRSTRSRSISWGADQTHVYDVPTPDSHQERESYIEARDISGAAATTAGVAAAVAAGAAMDEVVVEPESPGYEPERFTYREEDLRRGVHHDPSDHYDDVEELQESRDSPPLYRQPLFESVSDIGLGRFGVDSPGTEGAPPVQGYVEGEVQTPLGEERAPHVPGGFDDGYDDYTAPSRPSELDTREAVGSEAPAGSSIYPTVTETPIAETVLEDEPSWEPPLSKKDKKKREKAGKRTATFDDDIQTPVEIQPEVVPPEAVAQPEEEPEYFTSKKDKKKRDKAAKQTSIADSGPPTPMEVEHESAPREAFGQPEEEPDYFTSKKDKKKRDKAAKRTTTIDSGASTPREVDIDNVPNEATLQPEEEPDYFMSAKEKKKHGKAAQRSLSEQQPSVTPEVKPFEYPAEPIQATNELELEVGAEAEAAWEPPLTKKEKKKREKELQRIVSEDQPSVVPEVSSLDLMDEPPPLATEEPPQPSWEPSLTKKEKKKREKELQRSMSEDQPPLASEIRPLDAFDEPVPSTIEADPEASWEPPLSKKDKKKREREYQRGMSEDQPPLVSETTPLDAFDEPTIEAPPEASWEPPLSKKDKKKREKELQRSISEDQPPVASETTPLDAFNEPAIEAEPEASWEPPLSKKDKKKREKEVERQGFADVAEAVMTAGGVAAVATSLNDSAGESSDVKKGKKGKKARGFERDIRDIEPSPSVSTGAPGSESTSMPGSWSIATQEREAPLPTEEVDPFQFQVRDESPPMTPQEADPFSEFAETKGSKKKKKKRDSLRFSEPVASSPLRSEVAFDDYVGQRDATSSEAPLATNGYTPEDYTVSTEATAAPSFAAVAVEPDRATGRSEYDLDGRPLTESARRLSHDDVRSVASEPTDDRDGRRKSKSGRSRKEAQYYDEPDAYDDARSVVAASEHADAYETARKSKRRSRHEDDDTASVVSSRSKRDKDEASPSSTKDKKGGFFGMFSRKSTDTVPKSDDAPLSRQSTRDNKDDQPDDGERKHRRRKHRSSEFGDDDDTRSVVSESKSTRHRSRSVRDEDGQERHRSSRYEDDDDSSRHHHRRRTNESDSVPRRDSESGRHHHGRRTDDNTYDQGQSFLAMRVEDMPPLPVDDQVSLDSAQVKQEQGFGNLVSAEPDIDMVSDATADAPNFIHQDDPEITPEVFTASGNREIPPKQKHASWGDEAEWLPALPESRPTSPTAFAEVETPHRPPPLQRPTSTTAVPLRFPYGHQPLTPRQRMERAASFGGSLPSSPATPGSGQKTRQGRPASTEFRPLYLVEANRKTAEVEDVLPSLPSSKTTSRASSVIGSDEYESAVEEFGSPTRALGLAIDTDRTLDNQEDDYLDSGQTTPRATEFPKDVFEKPLRQEPQFYTWEDFAREEQMHNAAEREGQPTVGDYFDQFPADENERHPAYDSFEEELHHEELPPLPLSRSESPADRHDGVAMGTNIAAAAALGGAALLGYKALKREDEHRTANQPSMQDDHVTELDRIASSRDVAMVGPEPLEEVRTDQLAAQEVDLDQAPSFSRKSSSKKKAKKGKKGKAQVSDDVAEPLPEYTDPNEPPIRTTESFVDDEKPIGDGLASGRIEEVEVPHTSRLNELDRSLRMKEQVEDGDLGPSEAIELFTDASQTRIVPTQAEPIRGLPSDDISGMSDELAAPVTEPAPLVEGPSEPSLSLAQNTSELQATPEILLETQEQTMEPEQPLTLPQDEDDVDGFIDAEEQMEAGVAGTRAAEQLDTAITDQQPSLDFTPSAEPAVIDDPAASTANLFKAEEGTMSRSAGDEAAAGDLTDTVPAVPTPSPASRKLSKKAKKKQENAAKQVFYDEPESSSTPAEPLVEELAMDEGYGTVQDSFGSRPLAIADEGVDITASSGTARGDGSEHNNGSKASATSTVSDTTATVQTSLNPGESTIVDRLSASLGAERPTEIVNDDLQVGELRESEERAQQMQEPSGTPILQPEQEEPFETQPAASRKKGKKDKKKRRQKYGEAEPVEGTGAESQWEATPSEAKQSTKPGFVSLDEVTALGPPQTSADNRARADEFDASTKQMPEDVLLPLDDDSFRGHIPGVDVPPEPSQGRLADSELYNAWEPTSTVEDALAVEQTPDSSVQDLPGIRSTVVSDFTPEAGIAASDAAMATHHDPIELPVPRGLTPAEAEEGRDDAIDDALQQPESKEDQLTTDSPLQVEKTQMAVDETEPSHSDVVNPTARSMSLDHVPREIMPESQQGEQEDVGMHDKVEVVTESTSQGYRPEYFDAQPQHGLELPIHTNAEDAEIVPMIEPSAQGIESIQPAAEPSLVAPEPLPSEVHEGDSLQSDLSDPATRSLSLRPLDDIPMATTELGAAPEPQNREHEDVGMRETDEITDEIVGGDRIEHLAAQSRRGLDLATHTSAVDADSVQEIDLSPGRTEPMQPAVESGPIAAEPLLAEEPEDEFTWALTTKKKEKKGKKGKKSAAEAPPIVEEAQTPTVSREHDVAQELKENEAQSSTIAIDSQSHETEEADDLWASLPSKKKGKKAKAAKRKLGLDEVPEQPAPAKAAAQDAIAPDSESVGPVMPMTVQTSETEPSLQEGRDFLTEPATAEEVPTLPQNTAAERAPFAIEERPQSAQEAEASEVLLTEAAAVPGEADTELGMLQPEDLPDVALAEFQPIDLVPDEEEGIERAQLPSSSTSQVVVGEASVAYDVPEQRADELGVLPTAPEAVEHPASVPVTALNEPSHAGPQPRIEMTALESHTDTALEEASLVEPDMQPTEAAVDAPATANDAESFWTAPPSKKKEKKTKKSKKGTPEAQPSADIVETAEHVVLASAPALEASSLEDGKAVQEDDLASRGLPASLEGESVVEPASQTTEAEVSAPVLPDDADSLWAMPSSKKKDKKGKKSKKTTMEAPPEADVVGAADYIPSTSALVFEGLDFKEGKAVQDEDLAPREESTVGGTTQTAVAEAGASANPDDVDSLWAILPSKKKDKKGKKSKKVMEDEAEPSIDPVQGDFEASRDVEVEVPEESAIADAPVEIGDDSKQPTATETSDFWSVPSKKKEKKGKKSKKLVEEAEPSADPIQGDFAAPRDVEVEFPEEFALADAPVEIGDDSKQPTATETSDFWSAPAKKKDKKGKNSKNVVEEAEPSAGPIQGDFAALPDPEVEVEVIDGSATADVPAETEDSLKQPTATETSDFWSAPAKGKKGKKGKKSGPSQLEVTERAVDRAVDLQEADEEAAERKIPDTEMAETPMDADSTEFWPTTAKPKKGKMGKKSKQTTFDTTIVPPPGFQSDETRTVDDVQLVTEESIAQDFANLENSKDVTPSDIPHERELQNTSVIQPSEEDAVAALPPLPQSPNPTIPLDVAISDPMVALDAEPQQSSLTTTVPPPTGFVADVEDINALEDIQVKTTQPEVGQGQSEDNDRSMNDERQRLPTIVSESMGIGEKHETSDVRPPQQADHQDVPALEESNAGSTESDRPIVENDHTMRDSIRSLEQEAVSTSTLDRAPTTADRTYPIGTEAVTESQMTDSLVANAEPATADSPQTPSEVRVSKYVDLRDAAEVPLPRETQGDHREALGPEQSQAFQVPYGSAAMLETSASTNPFASSTGDEAPTEVQRDLEFTADIAQGLSHSGFDPDSFVRDSSFQRRSSPPGIVAEADPAEVFETTTKKKKKGKKGKNVQEAGESEFSRVSKSSEVHDQEAEKAQPPDEFNDTLERTLAGSGFNTALLQQAASSSNDIPTNGLTGDSADFSFGTSKRKKGKKAKRGQALEVGTPTETDRDDQASFAIGLEHSQPPVETISNDRDSVTVQPSAEPTGTDTSAPAIAATTSQYIDAIPAESFGEPAIARQDLKSPTAAELDLQPVAAYDVSTNDTADEPVEFSSITSKRKKGKKSKKTQAPDFEMLTPPRTERDDQASIETSFEHTQPAGETISRVIDEADVDLDAPTLGTAAATSQDVDITPAANAVVTSPRQDLEPLAAPEVEVVDPAAHFSIAGDREMDVDEMDKAYRTFKKNKEKQKKQRNGVAQAMEPEQPIARSEALPLVEDNLAPVSDRVVQNDEGVHPGDTVVFPHAQDVNERIATPVSPPSIVRNAFPGLQRVKTRAPSIPSPVNEPGEVHETSTHIGSKGYMHTSEVSQSLPAAVGRSPSPLESTWREGDEAINQTETPRVSDAQVHAGQHDDDPSDVVLRRSPRTTDPVTGSMTDNGLDSGVERELSPHRLRLSAASSRENSLRGLELPPNDHQDHDSPHPAWSFASLKGEGVPLPESPVLGKKMHDIIRDSGYQEINSPVPQRDSVESTSRAVPEMRTPTSRESLRSRRSAEPLRISTESDSGWEFDVPKTRATEERKGALHARAASRETTGTPLESTTKNRASYLFQSTPEALKDFADLPTPDENSQLSDYFRAPRREAQAGEDLERTAFSPPPTGTMSPRVPLDTIPEEHHAHKRTIAETGVGQDNSVKAIRRTETPQAIRARERALSPRSLPRVSVPSGTNRSANTPVSTDESIDRMPWPAVDDDNGAMGIDRTVPQKHSQQTSLEQRSPSVMSNRSNISANQFRSPAELRSLSRISNRSSTPTLRRIDRSLSGDLRAASRRGETGSAVGVRSSPKTIPFEPPPTPPSNEDEVMDVGASRSAAMSDVFQGYGDAQASQVSPTRPPSMRKRQSMHIMELESRLDQLVSENEALQDARQSRGVYPDQPGEQSVQEAINARDLQLREKENEISQIRAMLDPMQEEIHRLADINAGLTEANRNLVDDTNGRYATLQEEHAQAHEQWQTTSRELANMQQEHDRLSSGVRDIVDAEITTRLADKNLEIRQLREGLDIASEKIRALQVQLQSSKARDFLTVRDEDYFDGACQKLCQHVQQWVLRFSKMSDNRMCRLLTDLKDDKIEARLDNAILDGSDVDKLLGDRIRRRDVFMSVVMTMVWEYVFTRYLFGMDREQRQKLKTLEKTLSEVGPPRAVAQWRATTLTLLSKRPAFSEQRHLDTEAVASEVFDLLCALLPPPSNTKDQLLASLQKVIGIAVDLSVEMRTQRAEYIMLPPLQPEYDTNGDLVRKVHFNASLMNERSGMFSSNEELEDSHAVVKIVLFPLVVKKGDEVGEGEEEIVVCPAQVLVHNENNRGKKIVRVQSGAMEIDDPRRSRQSLISGQGSIGF
ncbi:hypothetical protein LTR37_010590 [Vermiconidia calcicola]|uniref:Uncharacterized protein n=1 Tax=Vermiconidia calcicola TaxID=1690605 RepID=A0ACC3N5R5_9PEZI|nr:hypothetical protein LTR37_010590 [Vermiconidia calcicola]